MSTRLSGACKRPCKRPLRLKAVFWFVILLSVAVVFLHYNYLDLYNSLWARKKAKRPLKPFIPLPGDVNWTGVWPPFEPPPLSVGPIIRRDVFTNAQQCLLNSSLVNDTRIISLPVLNSSDYELPSDIEQHYFDLLNYTGPLRQVPKHSYANFTGPWLENVFISTFCCDKPLSYFGGLVPLFIPWTDLFHTSSEKYFDSSWFNRTYSRRLISMLRKDVIYITVVQHAKGIFLDRDVVHPQDHWNILVLSGGGNGHIPVPLFLNELEFEPELATKPKDHLFVFAGNINMRRRLPMNWTMTGLAKRKRYEFSYRYYRGPQWKDVMRNGTLNLAPRGFGRTSFRLVECIQMGLIPIYLWDDIEWAPYKNSPAYVGSFGFSSHFDQLKVLVDVIARAIKKDPNYLKIPERTAAMKKIRESHYTTKGLMEQIKYFLHGDARSDLVCQRHPG